MRKHAQVNLAHYLILLGLLFVLLFLISPSWAGVATYQLDAGTTVPAPISYWLSGNATNVIINIIDASTSAVVYRFPTITGSNATKGYHSSVVTWHGEADGGGSVPQGDYKVKATVQSDMSGANLKPLWESCTVDGAGSNGWLIYGIAMNRNPTSPFYGRVYVGNYKNDNGKAKAVWEFNPDGSVIGMLPQPPDGGFGPNGPWGLCVDADDHVYVSNRSDAQPYGGAGPAVWRYRWDSGTSQWVCDPTIYGTFTDRYLGCNNAAGSALRLIDTYYSTLGAGVMSRLYPGVGDPPLSFAVAGGDKYTGDCFMQPIIDSSGTVFVAGINQSPNIGALTQWDLSGNAINDPSNPGPVKNRNVNLSQATGIALTSDNTTLWMARQATQTAYTDTEQSPFYKLPRSMAMTVNTSSPELIKYGWGTVYLTNQYPRFISVDGQSNLAVAGVDANIALAGSLFGLYAEPTGPNTSEVRIGRNTITWGTDYSPEFISGSAIPSTVPCGDSVQINVTGKDLNNIPSGYNDITSCKIFCPALGHGTIGDPATGTVMTKLTGPDADKQNTYQLTVSIAANAPTGPITADIYIYDVHGSITPGHGTVTINITGGTITGTITEGLTSLPAAGVTVRATKGSFYRESITNSAGVYSINVTPDTGYTVTPVTNGYGNTLPTEYNLQSNWPATPGVTDWPKTSSVTLGGTATANGRVWPMAITQATYDWSAHSYRAGGRTVCVTGTVLRHAADAIVTPNQKGYNGYYFVTDMLGGELHNAQQAVKVGIVSHGSECKKGDKIVIVGAYTVASNYNQGIITPASAPTILSSNNPVPDPINASSFTNASLYSNVIGTWYTMKSKAVTRIGTNGEFYVLTGDTPGIEFRVDMDTITTTGINSPQVGQVLDIYGVLDELAPSSSLRAIRPGMPGDVVMAGLVPNIAAAKALADDADVILESEQVTGIAGGGIPAGTAYIEEPTRVAGLRVHMPTLPIDIGPGDMTLVQGKMDTTEQGERLIEATTFSRNQSKRPLETLGMNCRDAATIKALGLFVKIWGKVTSVDADSFTISDGSPVPIKVICGTLTKPAQYETVRVRGIMSKDPSGPVLYMRNEQVDWATSTTYHPLPLPGAYKYPRDYLVLGPFKDANSVPPEPPGDPIPARTYRLEHDFIYDATGGEISELTLATAAPPRLGGTIGGMTWTRSQATGDNVQFVASSTPPANLTNCTFYAHIWIWSLLDQYITMRIGSDDSSQIIMYNDYISSCTGGLAFAIFESAIGSRLEVQGQDITYVPLSPGWNSVLIKVENGDGLSGADIQFVNDSYPIVPGYGGATPITGLGYLLSYPSP